MCGYLWITDRIYAKVKVCVILPTSCWIKFNPNRLAAHMWKYFFFSYPFFLLFIKYLFKELWCFLFFVKDEPEQNQQCLPTEWQNAAVPEDTLHIGTSCWALHTCLAYRIWCCSLSHCGRNCFPRCCRDSAAQEVSSLAFLLTTYWQIKLAGLVVLFKSASEKL